MKGLQMMFIRVIQFALVLAGEVNLSEGFSAATSSNNSAPKTIAVVGGGVGGLATAARIASSNDLPPSTKIILLEKNSKDMVGGRCGSFNVDIDGKGTFRHERGPSLLLLKDVYLDLFKECGGRDSKDFGLEIDQCKPAYQCVFEDGESIMLGFPANDEKELQAMEKKSRDQMNSLEPQGAEKWDDYMKSTAAFLDCGLPNFIEERLAIAPFPSFINEAVKGNFKSWPLKPHSSVLDETFESDKMRALASFQNLYVGLEPYANENQIAGGVIRKTAPAVFGLLAAIELHPTNKRAGVFAPIGGFQSVSKAFEGLANDCGVEIQYGKTVTSIQEDGVWFIDTDSDGENKVFIPTDITVCNADLPFATETLIKNGMSTNEADKSSQRYDWNNKFDFSSGLVAFHWSLDKECNALNTHNVFLMGGDRDKAEKSWSVIRDNDPTAPSFDREDFPFNFYVHRASATDSTAAPSGCDSIMVLVPCATLQRDENLSKLPRDEAIEGYKKQFDDTFVSKVRDAAIGRLEMLDGLQNLKNHIIDEVVDTPASYARDYNLAAGTPFALSHGFGQLSLTRPSQQSSDLDNLLFAGASTRPGNGVPLVLLGTKQVAEKALRKIQDQLKFEEEARKLEDSPI